MDEKQITDARTAQWAARLLGAFDAGASLGPLTSVADDPIAELTASGAYEIAAVIRRMREARGETVTGWKIGFTNRTIWDEYDVHAPIWGPMYDTTSTEIAGAKSSAEDDGADDGADEAAHDGAEDPGRAAEVRIGHLHEPRIEAEIAVRFARTPEAGMDEPQLLDCLDAVCHAFEIVQCPYPGWAFRPVDTMAAAGLHGGFVHGPWTAIGSADRADWLAAFADFTIVLRGEEERCGGVEPTTFVEDSGHGSSVLDGPLSALRWFVDGLAADLHGRFIEPGDIVTTGTVTRAFPIARGQTWSTAVTGLPLPGLAIRCV